nr:MAG TPA: hypothetical protein [Caudoviricetes sp.]
MKRCRTIRIAFFILLKKCFFIQKSVAKYTKSSIIYM